MMERIRWVTDFVAAHCTQCEHYHERAELPGPDAQKHLLRRARGHVLQTGHRVTVERGQLAGIEV